MGIRYYLSGCAHTNTFGSLLGECLKHDIRKTGSLVFIAGEPDNKHTTDIAAQWFTRELESIEKVFEKVYSISKKTPPHLARKWVRNADMIVLLGGNPLEQKKMCRKMKIWRILRDFEGIMLGMSAGAMNMSQYVMVLPISDEYPDFNIVPGLNKDGISIYPHNNTAESDYPEFIDLGNGEVYHRKDIIEASDDAGPFLLLQDLHEEIDGVDVCHHSFVRASDFEIDVMYENDARAWIANGVFIEHVELN